MRPSGHRLVALGRHALKALHRKATGQTQFVLIPCLFTRANPCASGTIDPINRHNARRGAWGGRVLLLASGNGFVHARANWVFEALFHHFFIRQTMIQIPFFGNSGNAADHPPKTEANSKTGQPQAAPHPLDEATGGVFSAATSGERAAKVRAWLATEPDAALMQEVYKALSARDKGAAKALREKLDDLKRSKGQEALAAEWAAKAEALLQADKFPIATTMAWQRDAAKAGAPLSKEPLASLKNRLVERIQGIEDLQTRVQVQREAAVLLAQRIELLSTKSWCEADAAQPALQADVQHWHAQTQTLTQDANWDNIDPRYASQLDAATQQLDLVAQAFADALTQTREAVADAGKPLPSVPVWADELRAMRGTGADAETNAEQPAPAPSADADKATANMARQQEAQQAIQPLLQVLEQELAQGHSKATVAAAHALRNALKDHARFLKAELESLVQTALNKAGELESWQRWRADQIRTELVQKAEALIHRAATAPEAEAAAPEALSPPETQPSTEVADADAGADMDAATSSGPQVAEDSAAPAAAQPQTADAAEEVTAAKVETPMPTSPHSPRKLQELLRQLREQWKEVDRGGIPNHALWRRFDQACNEAYRIVAAWLADMKQQAAEQKEKRLALIEEVKQWGEQLAARAAQEMPDWKAALREQHAFSRRWREAGHVSEKLFAELQAQWHAALRQASQPLEAAQKASVALRQKMIEEAAELGSGVLRIDAIKTLQQRWQQEAQRMPLERRQEQKLWDAFRKPIDAAFQRKTQQRAQAAAALSRRDQAVLDAVAQLDAANASGDAQAIRQAMQALDAAMRAQQTAAEVQAPSTTAPQPQQTPAQTAGEAAEPMTQAVATDAAPEAAATALAEAQDGVTQEPQETGAAAPAITAEAAPPMPENRPKPVVAVRGDDRPGAARPAAAVPAQRPSRDTQHGKRFAQSDGAHRTGKGGADRSGQERAPRLSDAAFRAQREAKERAQTTLRKLAAQAHGETLMQLLDAWEQRNAERLPAASELGKRVSNAQRNVWQAALSGQASDGQSLSAQEALLRLEMAAEVPTPAEHLFARRALQLQLLTRRNDPQPAQTWADDVAHVLASPHTPEQARRLQQALRALLK